MAAKSTNWQDGDLFGTTVGPGVSVSAMEEDIPTLTVATIVGVALVVLIAIAVVFVLGVLIDCRQQRVLAQKMGEMKRTKSRRTKSVNTVKCDGVSIVNNMEELATSMPPAAALRDVP